MVPLNSSADSILKQDSIILLYRIENVTYMIPFKSNI